MFYDKYLELIKEFRKFYCIETKHREQNNHHFQMMILLLPFYLLA